jgi:hypothetical protein
MPKSLSQEMIVTAIAAGMTTGSHVKGKRSAVWPLPKKGAPVYA